MSNVDGDVLDDMLRRICQPQRDLVARRLQAELRRSLFTRTSPPECVGRFTIIDRIGAGAMGVVFSAYDGQLDRRVALKHVPTPSAARRTRAVNEARALARMTHPNVVVVHDAGEYEDGVFIAMELVQGTTLQARIAGQPRAWQDALQVLIEAGRGLAAAHAAGLVHRDFKPSNVLIGADGRVKVADFGLVGTLDERENDRDPSGVLGTPAYMAPEQHAGRRSDARSDQYSFCLTAWEVLSGRHPLADATLSETADTGTPPRRSPSVDAFEHAKHAGPLGWPEPAVPRWVIEALRRGLAPDPANRWSSMDALLAALVPAPRRARRWALGIGASIAVVAAPLGWGVWSHVRRDPCSGAEAQLQGVWDDAQRARTHDAIMAAGAANAQAVWDRSAAELDRYAHAWATMHADTCAATTIRGEQSPEVMDLRMACLHRAKVKLRAVMQVLASADADVVQSAYEVVAGLPPLLRCADVDALQTDVEPPLPDDAASVETARTLLAEAEAEGDAGRYTVAHERVLGAEEALEGVDYGPVYTELALAQGYAFDQFGAFSASEQAFHRALQSAARWHQWREMGEAARWLLLVIGGRQHRTQEALALRGLALGLSEGEPSAEADALNNVAAVLKTQENYEEAEALVRRACALYEDALGPEHPYAANVRGNLANLLEAQGKYAAAETEQRRALALSEAALGSRHPQVARLRTNLATPLHRQGKSVEAEAELRRALVIQQDVLGPEHPNLENTLNSLAVVLLSQHKYAEAEQAQRASIRILEAIFDPDDPKLAAARENLGSILAAQRP